MAAGPGDHCSRWDGIPSQCHSARSHEDEMNDVEFQKPLLADLSRTFGTDGIGTGHVHCTVCPSTESGVGINMSVFLLPF